MSGTVSLFDENVEVTEVSASDSNLVISKWALVSFFKYYHGQYHFYYHHYGWKEGEKGRESKKKIFKGDKRQRHIVKFREQPLLPSLPQETL